MKKLIIPMILLSSCTVAVEDEKQYQVPQPVATVQEAISTDTAVIIHRQALPKVLVVANGEEEIGSYHSHGFIVQHLVANSGGYPVAVMVKY